MAKMLNKLKFHRALLFLKIMLFGYRYSKSVHKMAIDTFIHRVLFSLKGFAICYKV